MEKRKISNRFSPEVRERAVRMVLEHGKEHASQGRVSDDVEIAVFNKRCRQRRTGQTAADNSCMADVPSHDLQI